MFLYRVLDFQLAAEDLNQVKKLALVNPSVVQVARRRRPSHKPEA